MRKFSKKGEGKYLWKKYPKEYGIWKTMRASVMNSNHPLYPAKGGRGIKITPRWDNFETFLEDMGERPGESYRLGRKNSSHDFRPTNCYWKPYGEAPLAFSREYLPVVRRALSHYCSTVDDPEARAALAEIPQ